METKKVLNGWKVKVSLIKTTGAYKEDEINGLELEFSDEEHADQAFSLACERVEASKRWDDGGAE